MRYAYIADPLATASPGSVLCSLGTAKVSVVAGRMVVMNRRRTRIRSMERLNAELLGDDYKFTLDPKLAAERKQRRKERRDEAAKRWRAITTEWAPCLAPGCKTQTAKRLSNDVEFPICPNHAAAVWQAIEMDDERYRDDYITDSIEAMVARRDAIRAERDASLAAFEAEWKADLKADQVEGDIYFIRLGDLVKVGWSSNLHKRLKQYGASAELLAHYPAYRSDETHLHRQLKPSRAKGREWYHDDSTIRLYVLQAVAKHGQPTVKVNWTQPKQVVASKHSKGVA